MSMFARFTILLSILFSTTLGAHYIATHSDSTLVQTLSWVVALVILVGAGYKLVR